MKRGFENSSMKKSLNESKQEIKTSVIKQREFNALKTKDIDESKDSNNNLHDNIDISTKRMDTSHDTNLDSLNSASTINDKKGKNIPKNNKLKQYATYSVASIKRPVSRDIDSNSGTITHKKNEHHDEEIFLDDQNFEDLSVSDKKFRANSLNCYNRSMHSSDFKSKSKENLDEKSNTEQKNSKNKFKGNFLCGQGTIQGFLTNKNQIPKRSRGDSHDVINDYKSVDKNEEKRKFVLYNVLESSERNYDSKVGQHMRKDSGKNFKLKDVILRKGIDSNSKRKKTMIVNLNGGKNFSYKK